MGVLDSERQALGQRIARVATVMAALLLTVAASPWLQTGEDERRLEEQGQLCATPHGFHPCECVHEVPSGTRAEEYKHASGKSTLRLHFPNATMNEIDECTRSPPRPSTGSMDSPRRRQMDSMGFSVADPCALGYAHAAPMEAFYYTSEDVDVTSFSADFVVPDAPESTVENILYYWIGLQCRGSKANPVIQPVLSYVPNASANNWYFESWNCCPAGHKLKSTSVAVGGPGETLRGSMVRDAASGVWTISSTNAAGASSVLISDDTNSGLVRTWDWVDIVLETYRVERCDQYSAGKIMSFESLELGTSDGRLLTPTNWSFAPYIDGKYLSPQESAQFQGCCNGKFAIEWPAATMTQNAD